MSRVAIVTGSTRGIGLAIARACAARGMRVVIHGRDRARVEEVAAGLSNAVGIASDLASPGGADALVSGALAALGGLDVVVNNAASSAGRAPLWELAPEELEAVVATSLLAPMRVARAALAWAVPRGAPIRIVNVSSELATWPREGAAPYIASKAGLEGLTRALARDAAPTAAVVTAVALGAHRTELAERMLGAAAAAALPPAERAADLVWEAIAGPAEAVHGRVLGGGAPARLLDTGSADWLAPPGGPSPRVREALARAKLDRYPDPSCARLRKVLAARWRVGLDAIVVGGGTTELLDRAFALATRPGEAIVAHDPTWPLLPHLCRARRVEVRTVPYRLAGGRADPDLDAVAAAIDRAVRLVYLSSPANPTGAAIDRAAFERFLARVPDGATIVVDEAYAEYVRRPDALDAIALARATDRPVIALRTFSKLYGLAGLRIAYAVAPPALARALAAAAPPFPVARVAEDAALAALADPEHARAASARAADARAALERDLDARGIARLASDAPFLLAAVPGAPGPRFFGSYAMLRIEEAEAPHGTR